jgi:hypothetical protein
MIKNIPVLTTDTQLVLATKETANLAILFCNTNTVSIYLDMWAFPSSTESVSDTTQVVKQFLIPASDTFVWTGNEKLLLDIDDTIYAKASATGLTATLSYKEL